jgi:transcriptional regulator GlxA family with amidase domain
LTSRARYSGDVDFATCQTRPLMGTAVRRYVAYHHEGMEPGTHLGLPSPSLTMDRAWEMIIASNGALPLDEVAGGVGWSRRHLDREFVSEFGLTPKDVARVARFTHSREMLQRHPRLSMGALGSACGYFDQAHMAREWNQLAREPASSWWTDEGVRFFQAPSLEACAS